MRISVQTSSHPFDGMPLHELCTNTIRTLAIDAVERAGSGHPGTPMALAPAAYVLWTRLMRFSPRHPNWFDRDRFVLSNGHASMLLYALLYLTGFDVSLHDIKNFRQWGSKTPGHPEHGHVPGVDTTTGPLGQGLMNAVGMAIAEAHLAAVFNRPRHLLVDHRTYVFCSDGDLMEGASHEAGSLAGHLKLGKLIVLYDDNHITIEGDTELAYSDDVGKRFEAYGWHVQNLGDEANDLGAIEAAFRTAQEQAERPALIVLRSHIAFGAPHAQDTKEAHGAPLGADEARLTKRNYGWPPDSEFIVPDRALEHMRSAQSRGEALVREWHERLAAYRQAHPALAQRFEQALAGTPPAQWDVALPVFAPDAKGIATRKASSKVLNGVAAKIPWLMGGAADLAPSTSTLIEGSGSFAAGAYTGRNLHFGIREHVMCAAASGMALHGGVRPYASTFLIFSDYGRPAIRLAALMGLPVIYVMTHDSIGLGEDGPTHQPVEHLASLRAIPNLWVIRPADANETAYAWRAAIERMDGPTMLVLTRQAVPVFDRTRYADARGVLQGGYVLSKEPSDALDLILIATGSEVQIVLSAQRELLAAGHAARVVSLPSWELFRSQPIDYRDAVLPPGITARIAVEAGSPQGWLEWVGGGGAVIGVDRFGASAPGHENLEHYGLTVEQVMAAATQLLTGKR
jgi:transketolase